MLSVSEQIELSKEIDECEEKLQALLQKRDDFRKELLKSNRLGRVIENCRSSYGTCRTVNGEWKVNSHLWASGDFKLYSQNLRFLYRIKE